MDCTGRFKGDVIKKVSVYFGNEIDAYFFMSQFTRYATKPFGVMVSSPDQTPQVPFMFFLIIHYFERPAPSVRLVKSIHLRAYGKYWAFREL